MSSKLLIQRNILRVTTNLLTVFNVITLDDEGNEWKTSVCAKSWVNKNTVTVLPSARPFCEGLCPYYANFDFRVRLALQTMKEDLSANRCGVTNFSDSAKDLITQVIR